MRQLGEENNSNQLLCQLPQVTRQIQGITALDPSSLEPSLESVESDALPASGEIAGEVFCLHSCPLERSHYSHSPSHNS